MALTSQLMFHQQYHRTPNVGKQAKQLQSKKQNKLSNHTPCGLLQNAWPETTQVDLTGVSAFLDLIAWHSCRTFNDSRTAAKGDVSRRA